MQARQLGVPVLLEPEGGEGEGEGEGERRLRAHRLRPIPLGSPPFPEEGLQDLLARCPEVLPIEELEPGFAPLLLLGREIPTPRGALDLLYASPEGRLTLVETKLWTNPEARREVVGQILDYAQALSCWSFSELDAAVRKARADRAGILEVLRRHEPDLEEDRLIDRLSRDLRRGRFLLVIAGNGIREGVEELAGSLQKTPGLHFSLALVELALYRLEPDRAWPILVQPRTLARTVEIERAIVTVHAPEGLEVEVALPAEDEAGRRRARRRLSAEEFYEELAEHTSPATAEAVRALSARLEELGLLPVWRASSVSLRLPDPEETGNLFTIVVFRTSGTFFLGWLDRVAEKYGEGPVNRYLEGVVRLTGAERAPQRGGTKEHPLEALVEKSEEFVRLVGQFLDDLRAAAAHPPRPGSNPS